MSDFRGFNTLAASSIQRKCIGNISFVFDKPPAVPKLLFLVFSALSSPEHNQAIKAINRAVIIDKQQHHTQCIKRKNLIVLISTFMFVQLKYRG